MSVELRGIPRIIAIAGVLAATGRHARAAEPSAEVPSPDYAGAASCRACHEPFYELWSTSRHGTAMQPFTVALFQERMKPQAAPLALGDRTYRFETDDSAGWVRETTPDGETKHAVAYVLGGKNVYYLLTGLDRGRLQVLPVAYDVRTSEWFDTPASAVRHFADATDEALDWRERDFTFNASCHGCHVSQLSTNYDPRTDSYRTTWTEPGINCETCHGGGAEHVRVCREAAQAGKSPEDLKIISMKRLSPGQRDAACAACHAKLVALSADFQPGEEFFDHFDLGTLDDPDFYPDGRDLGENYTYTSWLMNPCARSGRLECLHCHTSSGRYRFADEPGSKANGACLPCHAERVANVAEHGHHAAEGPAGRCTACHMPETGFARMRRTDHSLRPPMPAATMAFGSPNACNLCHQEKSPAWANEQVKAWHAGDYQAATLRAAGLVIAARDADWTRLAEIGAYLADPRAEEVVAAALARLLQTCPDDAKWPILIRAARHPSPLVRSSAAAGLAACPQPEAVDALLAAAGDDRRVVRIRAGAALAGKEHLVDDPALAARMRRAQGEFEAAMRTRLDDPGAHLALGNYQMDRGATSQALAEFEAAERLDPRSVPARINAALAYNLLGENAPAEAKLRAALQLAPESAAAWLNLGLLLGEAGRRDEAMTALRTALKADPASAVAAYNLGVLLADSDLTAAIGWCEKAATLAPAVPRYAYTLAYFQQAGSSFDAAAVTLENLIERHPSFADAHLLLGRIHVEGGDPQKAHAVFARAAAETALPENARRFFAAQAEALKSDEK